MGSRTSPPMASLSLSTAVLPVAMAEWATGCVPGPSTAAAPKDVSSTPCSLISDPVMLSHTACSLSQVAAWPAALPLAPLPTPVRCPDTPALPALPLSAAVQSAGPLRNGAGPVAALAALAARTSPCPATAYVAVASEATASARAAAAMNAAVSA
ncbi:hypothetical protein V8C86DRAFT_2497706 [Haematococcus lacustris]